MAKIKIDTHRNATQKHKSTTIKKVEQKRTNERTEATETNQMNKCQTKRIIINIDLITYSPIIS